MKFKSSSDKSPDLTIIEVSLLRFWINQLCHSLNSGLPIPLTKMNVFFDSDVVTVSLKKSQKKGVF